MSPTSNFLLDKTINLTSYEVPVLIAIISFCWYLFKRHPQPPLPPGPRGLPIVGNLPFIDPNLHTYVTDLARTHGPIFKLNLGSKLTVVVNSSSLARDILKDINFSNRDVPLTGRAATYGGLDIVWQQYGAEWRMLRKVCVVKLLSRKTLDSFYELRRKEVRERTRLLYQQGLKESPVNVGDQLFLTMINLTMNMLWGGSVKPEEMESVGTEFKGVISEITRLLSEPNVSEFFPWLARFDLQGLVKKMLVCVRELDAIFDRAIEQMQSLRSKDGDNGECKDFLQYLMKLKDEGDTEVPITINHVRAVLTDMVVGGTDTSTNTIEFAMAELISNPSLMKRAQQELDEVVGKDNIVEESHIARLPYIQAIMKETLRLHPTIPLLVPHRPAETAVVGGYTIPKDTKIFINVWSIQRDPKVWKNPTQFRPERFLDKSYDFTGSDYSYLPFGSGRRNCAGVALAERMVLYSLATLLHSFDWKIPKGKVLNLEEKYGIVLKLKTPLVALPVPRLSSSNLYL